LKRLDSRFHGNDRKKNSRTFYDFINNNGPVKGNISPLLAGGEKGEGKIRARRSFNLFCEMDHNSFLKSPNKR
jgi:hypothetical protein